ncbi:UNVERIFIED_CONTAM: hypothetical protein Slati_1447000 [Sesamum latifolium]|uniref:Uncharacterized protein n=1 Tax=Sesamum latifolium TaxID=2727402 RepID=A0AAW2X7J9_9LAMI
MPFDRAPPAREFSPPLLITHPVTEPGLSPMESLSTTPTAGVDAPPPKVLEVPAVTMQNGFPLLGSPAAIPSRPVVDGGGLTTGPRPSDAVALTGFTPAAVQNPTPILSQPVVNEGGLTTDSRPFADAAPASFIPAAATTPTPHIYVGNVPLTMNSHSFYKIAAAFHNSSRKTLSFVPPTMQNGEIVVRPSLKIIRDGSQWWSTTAVGYFFGRRPYFHHVNEYVRSV